MDSTSDEDEVFWDEVTDKEIKSKIKNCRRRTTIIPSTLARIQLNSSSENESNDSGNDTKVLEDSFGNIFYTKHIDDQEKTILEQPDVFNDVGNTEADLSVECEKREDSFSRKNSNEKEKTTFDQTGSFYAIKVDDIDDIDTETVLDVDNKKSSSNFEFVLQRNSVSSFTTSPSSIYVTANEACSSSAADCSIKSENVTVRKCKTPLKEKQIIVDDILEPSLDHYSIDDALASSVSEINLKSNSDVVEHENNVVNSSSDLCVFLEEDEVGDEDSSKENKECQTSFWYIPLPKKREQITQQTKTNVSKAETSSTPSKKLEGTPVKTPIFKTPQQVKKIHSLKKSSSQRKCKRALIEQSPISRSKTFTKSEVESPVAKYIKRPIPPLISNVRSKSIGRLFKMNKLPSKTPSKIPRLITSISNPTIYRHPKEN